MKLIIDAMGGDRGFSEVVKGVADASLESESRFIIVGDENKIRSELENHRADISRIDVEGAECEVEMTDDPMVILGSKRNSSMGVGLKLLKREGDAFISTGNTGALFTGASTIIRNASGIKRAAIATVLPFEFPILLLDSGANVNVTPEYFTDWARLGTVYSKHALGIDNPTVGLLNNGSEPHKGGAVREAAYGLLKEMPGIDFVGNVESSELAHAPCDVLLTDGFTGNVTLKLIEGMSAYFFSTMKHIMTESVLTKIASAPLSGRVREMRNVFDPTEYGGAPILGLSKPVIKAHGSSGAQAITSAIKRAEAFVRSGATEAIREEEAKVREGAGEQ
ncbi:MAG: phosphate acyltransferase PlsX [Clostridia bacterium]|nr:phosphate acyltransferase PlsX [Clostridia bacterium]MBR7032489.1 phosphate acyltransferase PlsX [Clostridia bacterium]